jgi:cellulose synthase/poly-beta-1,6-N-acetylglucosamine synthase-like glycosyltransferase
MVTLGGVALPPSALVALAVGFAALAVAAVPYLVIGSLALAWRPWGAPEEVPGAGEPRVDEDLPTVSVVLPTYDEAAIVERKLRELTGLDYPDERLEIVVADDSTDATPDIVESFAAEAPIPVTVVRGHRAGVAAAVTQAVDSAANEVILRTDCDAELAPDALRRAVETLATPDVGLVTGQQTAVVGGGSAVEADYRGLLGLVQAVETRLDSTFIVHGPCCAFRRADFEPLPADTVADDTAIGVAIRRAGKRVVMDPRVTFAEAGTSGLRARRGRKDRRALGLLQQLVRHRDLLGRCGRYGRVVLPLNWGFLLVGPWALLGGLVGVTAAAVLGVGPAGLAVPATIAATGWLGARERLGPLQPVHAVLDAQLSLLIASVRLVRGEADGTWTPDAASREAFEP